MTFKAHSPFSHLKAPVALISDNDDTYVNTSAALFNGSLFCSFSLSLHFTVTHPLFFPSAQSSSRFSGGLQSLMGVSPLMLHAIIVTRRFQGRPAREVKPWSSWEQNALTINTCDEKLL